MNWQEEVAKCMKSWGFRTCQFNPCLYMHDGREMMCLVHGDDFVCVGSSTNLSWLKARLSDRFEIKTKLMGLKAGESREERILNRVIRVTPEGWEYEADQRHADLIIQESGAAKLSTLSHPGGDKRVIEEEEESEELTGKDATRFRAVAARANYLQADRPDIQYAVKEICRRMAKPVASDWQKLVRLARYLKAAPRLVWEYRWQKGEKGIAPSGYSDSDWAGYRKTAKSTSGGLIMRGAHLIKSWSKTQDSITLSSAEAELVALSKLAMEVLGVRTMCEEWGMSRATQASELFADASAALSIAKRQGAGKMRHINVKSLWLQAKSVQQVLKYCKVKGEENPADGLTKHVKQELIDHYLRIENLKIRTDRADASLKLAGQ